jgi:tetratricopeptide (TPR) repeat protein
MNRSLALDDRVAALAEGVDADIRRGLRQSLDTLRVAGNVPGAIVSVARLLEGPNGLLGAVAVAHDRAVKGGGLDNQIEDLAQNGIVPGEIASDLHWVRVRANKARHQVEKAELTVNDAETAIDRALRVVHWFYCECDRGPQLATIYALDDVAAAHDRRGAKLLAGGDTDQALTCFDEAIRLVPAQAGFRAHRAEAHLARGDRARAARDANEALRLDPNTVEAHLVLGVTSYEAEDYGATIRHCGAALVLDPDRAQAYYYRGLGYLGVGDFRRARADFEAAEALDPAYPVPKKLSSLRVQLLSCLSWIRRLRPKRG